MLHQQIRHTIYWQRTYLPYIGSIIQHTGSKNLIELQRLINELNRGNQHFLRLAGSPHRSSRSKMLVSIAPELLYIQML